MYKDGKKVDQLPDNSAIFSLRGYKTVLGGDYYKLVIFVAKCMLLCMYWVRCEDASIFLKGGGG